MFKLYASFTSYTKIDVSENLSSLIKDTTQISYINSYDVANSTSIYNEVEITLPEGEASHLLFITSYAAINWVINNPHNTELQGVIFNSFAPGTTISNAGSAIILEISELKRDRSGDAQIKAYIAAMTDKNPDYIFNKHDMVDVEIPNVIRLDGSVSAT